MSRKTLASQIIGDVIRVAKELGHVPSKHEYLAGIGAFPEDTIDLAFGSWETGLRAAGLKPRGGKFEKIENRKPKILLFDLETSGILVRVFGLFGNDRIGVNQIVQGTSMLSFAAKYLGEDKIYYYDTSKQKDIYDDLRILKSLHKLLLEADVVISQNGKGFDEKVAAGRFILKGLPPIPKLVHMDTLIMSKRFKFDSHKLEYMAKILDVPHKKLMNRKFIGMEMWNECHNRNPEAWAEMREYNIADVLALEGVYSKLMPWGVGAVDLNVYHGDNVYRCQCGGSDFEKRGFARTKTGKFQKFKCKNPLCGAWHQAKGVENNFMSGAKKASLKTPKESA